MMRQLSSSLMFAESVVECKNIQNWKEVRKILFLSVYERKRDRKFSKNEIGFCGSYWNLFFSFFTRHT